MLPGMLGAFRREHSDIQVLIQENNLAKIKEQLQLGRLDCVFAYHLPENPTMVSRQVLKEYGVLAISKNLFMSVFSETKQQRLLLTANHHRLADFARCPMIRMGKRGLYGRLFDQCCAEEGFVPQVALSSVNPITMLLCAVQGIGMTMLPDIYVQQLTDAQRSRMYLFRWDYAPTMQTVAVQYLKNSYPSSATRTFVNFAQQYFKTADRELTLDSAPEIGKDPI